ncbi:hypothetical protein RZN22_07900, partial [Bacillaceae bacterium S4-13-58]
KLNRRIFTPQSWPSDSVDHSHPQIYSFILLPLLSSTYFGLYSIVVTYFPTVSLEESAPGKKYSILK